MTSESTVSVSEAKTSQTLSLIDCSKQLRLKSEGEKMLLILPKVDPKTDTTDWSEFWQELKSRLHSRERSWQPGSPVHLIAKDRLLDGRQLQTIAEALAEFELKLNWVCTSRRQTAVAAVTAGYSVEQQTPTKSLASDTDESNQELADPLYLRNTVRSGVEIRHPGTVVIMGDLNPGGIILAARDIFVWGRLRGIAHAGAQGNRECRIMALQMEPTQLRIADALARAPEVPPLKFEPEIAYMTPQGIRLCQAANFGKTYSFSEEVGGWINSQIDTPQRTGGWGILARKDK
ncbi:MAG: septum site-determining protein MinC [Moorea sp. SIO2B7]|nr:septum site-determining protein MinC [Moorena sp. SIO2B7]